MQTNWWFPASTYHRIRNKIFKIQDALNLENSTKRCWVFITWWIQTCSSFESHVNLINSHRCRIRPRSWWGRPALCTRALMPDWVKMKWVCRGGECHQRPEEHAPIKLHLRNKTVRFPVTTRNVWTFGEKWRKAPSLLWSLEAADLMEAVCSPLSENTAGLSDKHQAKWSH